jgi:hypothetical protein
MMKANPDYEWVAEYDDGTELREGLGSDVEHHYGHIDMEKLTWLWLEKKPGEPIAGVNIRTGEFYYKHMYFSFRVPEGKRTLINFKRTRHDFEPSGIKTWSQNHIGFKVTSNNEVHQAIIAIEPDGNLLIVPKK